MAYNVFSGTLNPTHFIRGGNIRQSVEKKLVTVQSLAEIKLSCRHVKS